VTCKNLKFPSDAESGTEADAFAAIALHTEIDEKVAICGRFERDTHFAETCATAQAWSIAETIPFTGFVPYMAKLGLSFRICE